MFTVRADGNKGMSHYPLETLNIHYILDDSKEILYIISLFHIHVQMEEDRHLSFQFYENKHDFTQYIIDIFEI